MADDAERRLATVRGWEKLHAEQAAEIARLKAENLLLFAKVPESTYDALNERLGAAEALISWIDGQCVDEADHMVIREGINRYWDQNRKPETDPLSSTVAGRSAEDDERDIVDRLRDWDNDETDEAADEIERLREAARALVENGSEHEDSRMNLMVVDGDLFDALAAAARVSVEDQQT